MIKKHLIGKNRKYILIYFNLRDLNSLRTHQRQDYRVALLLIMTGRQNLQSRDWHDLIVNTDRQIDRYTDRYDRQTY